MKIAFQNPYHTTARPGPLIVEDALAGWHVEAWMTIQGNRAVIRELCLRPAGKATPPGGITQKVLRQIRYGSFGPFFLASLRRFGFGRVRIGSIKKRVPPLDRPRPRRAHGRDDRFFAVVARDYLAAIAGGSGSPIQDLARRRRVSVSRTRDMVREARERGLLSFSQAGIRGGELLPRAITLLNKSRRTRR